MKKTHDEIEKILDSTIQSLLDEDIPLWIIWRKLQKYKKRGKIVILKK